VSATRCRPVASCSVTSTEARTRHDFCRCSAAAAAADDAAANGERLAQPTSGSVFVGGKIDRGLRPHRTPPAASATSSRRGPLPHMTVERNAGLALELAGAPAPEIARRTADVGARRARLRRVRRALSVATLRRAAPARRLARALPRIQRCCLMDEPFWARSTR